MNFCVFAPFLFFRPNVLSCGSNRQTPLTSISLTSAIFSFFLTSVLVGLEHLGGMAEDSEVASERVNGLT